MRERERQRQREREKDRAKNRERMVQKEKYSMMRWRKIGREGRGRKKEHMFPLKVLFCLK